MALAFWEQGAVPREENSLEEKAVTQYLLYDKSLIEVGWMHHVNYVLLI